MNILLLKTIHVHYLFNQPFYLLTIDCYCVNWFCTFRWRRGRRLRAVYELSMWYVFIRHKVTQPNNRPTNQPTNFYLFCLSIVPKKGKEKKHASTTLWNSCCWLQFMFNCRRGRGEKQKIYYFKIVVGGCCCCKQFTADSSCICCVALPCLFGHCYLLILHAITQFFSYCCC